MDLSYLYQIKSFMRHGFLNLVCIFPATSDLPVVPNFMSQNISLIILLYWNQNMQILQNVWIHIRPDSKHPSLTIFSSNSQVRMWVSAIRELETPSASFEGTEETECSGFRVHAHTHTPVRSSTHTPPFDRSRAERVAKGHSLITAARGRCAETRSRCSYSCGFFTHQENSKGKVKRGSQKRRDLHIPGCTWTFRSPSCQWNHSVSDNSGAGVFFDWWEPRRRETERLRRP